MAVLVTVAGLATPAATHILRGTALTQGGQLINEQLGLARQLALSRNLPVEVRFYQYNDPQSGETSGAGAFRAMQLFEIQESGGTPVALGKVVPLPQTIIVDSGATLSSIIGGAQSSAWPQAITGTALDQALPRVGRQYNAVAFRFLPDGATNLSPQTGSWFLTLHSLKDGDGLAAPQGNFLTLQIDAANGHLKTFRP